ncbi:hypothetical protein [Acetobacter okinawensis]|uniref:hypothetical protein n=1 Tax=Acetobacter okinawensis TaxID=1076594 RepID=UPI0039EC6FE7
MTDQKPTGVFVRLPLSGEQEHDLFVAATTPVHTKTLLEGCLIAIGTPVTGGELEDIDIVDAAYGNSDAKYVRQSDAQAQIAARDAEIVRLRDALNNLVKSSKKVNARGASVGPQWVGFGISLGMAECALKGGMA